MIIYVLSGAGGCAPPLKNPPGINGIPAEKLTRLLIFSYSPDFQLEPKNGQIPAVAPLVG